MTTKGRVLVVDDEADLRDVIRGLLAAEGYEVSTAASGVEALRLLGAHPFDVVTMDLRMPGMSGRDTLAELRRIAPDLVSVVVSGYSTPEDDAAVRALGAYDVIAKPFDIDRLVTTVAGAMGEARRSSPMTRH